MKNIQELIAQKKKEIQALTSSKQRKIDELMTVLHQLGQLHASEFTSASMVDRDESENISEKIAEMEIEEEEQPPALSSKSFS